MMSSVVKYKYIIIRLRMHFNAFSYINVFHNINVCSYINVFHFINVFHYIYVFDYSNAFSYINPLVTDPLYLVCFAKISI